MRSDGEDSTLREIEGIGRSVNVAGRSGSVEELQCYFHTDLVIGAPDFIDEMVGHLACIASYREFARQATVRRYQESERAAHVWGDRRRFRVGRL